MARRLYTLCPKSIEFQVCVAADGKDGFLKFCRYLATSLPNITAALHQDICDALKTLNTSHRDVIASHEVELSVASPTIESSNTDDQ